MKPRIIAIAGLSGSGKTTLAHRLADQLGAPILALDDYYVPLSEFSLEERHAMNFDDPAMFDFPLLASQLEALGRGETIDRPNYDFVRFTRDFVSTPVRPAPIVILEGQYALFDPEVLAACSLKIFLHVEPETCLSRRIMRDVELRGRTPEEVRWRFHDHVLPMYRRHILPSADAADLHLRAPFTVTEAMAAVADHLPTLV